MGRSVRLFVRLSRPWFLLGGVLVYALGAGIADYLGAPINWGLYLLGQAITTCIQLSAQYLNEYFDAPADEDNPSRTFFSGGSGAIGPGKLSKNAVLMAVATTLTISASLIVLLIAGGHVSPLVAFILSLGFFGAFFYSVPPIRLTATGYGELTTSIVVAFLVPAFAFVLQFGDLHRLLLISAIPLAMLHLAMLLAFEFPDYATDIRFEKRTLLVRMGWERGMLFHNLLILGAFALFGAAALLDVPIAILFPTFLLFPLGLLQIWQMRNIAAGARPNWSILTFAAVALFAGTAYMLAFSYWIR